MGEQFGLDAKSATFLEESYLEVDYFEGKISECCYNSGKYIPITLFRFFCHSIMRSSSIFLTVRINSLKLSLLTIRTVNRLYHNK